MMEEQGTTGLPAKEEDYEKEARAWEMLHA